MAGLNREIGQAQQPHFVFDFLEAFSILRLLHTIKPLDLRQPQAISIRPQAATFSHSVSLGSFQ
jgi:hypothetical protein